MLSVVMPCRDNLDYTRQAIGSLVACTREPLQLVVVDDQSTDGTPAYLRELPIANKIILTNDMWRNVTASWNLGIAACTGEYIAIVNNDLIFTQDWDAPLIREVQAGAWAASPYHTAKAKPGDFPAGAMRHPIMFRLFGACWLSDNCLYQRTGTIPESLVMWHSDLWLFDRIASLGGRMVQCRESYVHHYGSRTVSRLANPWKIGRKDTEQWRILQLQEQEGKRDRAETVFRDTIQETPS